MSDGFNTMDGELTLTLDGQAVGAIANNLTTDVEGYALDARQGKVLDERKLDTSRVVNNHTTVLEGYALDARQGKWLAENKLGFSDVVNDLTTDDKSKVLSAAQGKALKALLDQYKALLDQKKPLDGYPVGSIYLSVSSASPASLFGGTWTQLMDCFLLGAGASYANGATGGEAAHTLTWNEMPVHDHDLRGFWSVADTPGTECRALSYNDIGEDMYATQFGNSSIQNAGGNQPHNNMPPYLAVYMWKRVA